MAHVNCNVTTCSYNKNNGCYMNPINIGGRGAAYENLTCCGSFLNQSHYSNLAEYTSMRGETETVECNVDSCKHNCDRCCSLDSVDIGGGSNPEIYTETLCNSFEKL